MTSRTALPDKQFFKIGDVVELVGVKAHVLRYWEGEFRVVKPLQTRGKHRMYRRVDVDLLCLIRRLLYDDGYTIPGAKRRMRELAGDGAPRVLQDGGAAREVGLRAELVQVREELGGLLRALDRKPALRKDGQASGTATVTAVVTKTALLQRPPT